MKRYSNELDLRRFFEASRRLWWVYAAAFVAAMAVIIWYAGRHMPEYEAEGIILIEDSEDTGAVPTGMESFARTFSMGGFGSTVDNEVLVIATSNMRSRVIRRLGLNITTVLNQPGGGRELLFENEPVLVKAPQEMLDTLRAAIKIKLTLDHGKVTAKATKGLFAKKIGEVKGASVPCVLPTPYGDFSITPGPTYSPDEKATMTISVSGTPALSEAMTKKISVEIVDKTADAISIKYLDPNPTRAKAIINDMMDEYNHLRRERKHAVARQEVAYYTDRVNELFGELDSHEKKIENFRTEKQALATGEEAAMLMQTTFNDERSIKETETKRAYYVQVIDAITSNPTDIIPTTESLGNPLIGEYNSTIMRRKRLERSATADNPAMKLIDQNLAEMRASIRRNAENIINRLDMELATSRRLTGKAESRLATMPGIQRELSDLYRDQGVKNQLYLALLNKKEEAELKVFTETDPGFIIEEAYADTKPSMKKLIIISALLLFLAGAGSVVLVLMWMRFTDRTSSPKDLASMGLEPHAANTGTTPASMKKLRALLTEADTPRVLYTLGCAPGSESLPGVLAGTLDAVGSTTSILKPGGTDNDRLLAPGFRDELDAASAAGGHVFVEVPDPDSPDELLPLLREENAGILAFISSREKRGNVRKLLGSIPADKLFVAIVDAR